MRAAGVLSAALLVVAFSCWSPPALSAPQAPPDTVTETVRLHHMRPSRVVEALRTTRTRPSNKGQGEALYPAGVSSVAADDLHMTLTAQGTAKGIADLKEVVALLDVEPVFVLVDMRVLRSRPAPGGRNTVTVLSSPKVSTVNNVMATASIGSDVERTTVSITPRVNGDGTVTLTCRLAILTEGASRNRQVTGMRRVRAGAKTLILYLSDEGAPGTPASRSGPLPDPGKVAGYYLEVTARPQRQRSGAPGQ